MADPAEVPWLVDERGMFSMFCCFPLRMENILEAADSLGGRVAGKSRKNRIYPDFGGICAPFSEASRALCHIQAGQSDPKYGAEHTECAGRAAAASLQGQERCFLGIVPSGRMDLKRVSVLFPDSRKITARKGLSLEVLCHSGGASAPEKLMERENRDCVEFYTSENRKKYAASYPSLNVGKNPALQDSFFAMRH